MLIHLAETQDELNLSQTRHALRPVAYLDRIKFWGPTIVAAHGVWITPVEMALLKAAQLRRLVSFADLVARVEQFLGESPRVVQTAPASPPMAPHGSRPPAF